jgi:hypothetical protein
MTGDLCALLTFLSQQRTALVRRLRHRPTDLSDADDTARTIQDHFGINS